MVTLSQVDEDARDFWITHFGGKIEVSLTVTFQMPISLFVGVVGLDSRATLQEIGSRSRQEIQRSPENALPQLGGQ